MSAADNKKIARRVLEEVWNERRLEVADQIIAASATTHDPSTPSMGKGPAELKRVVKMYTDAFPDTRFKVDSQLAEGNLVVTRWTVQGTHRGALQGIPPTGRKVSLTGTVTDRIEGGKIHETWSNWDALGLMQQIGAVQLPEARAAVPPARG